MPKLVLLPGLDGTGRLFADFQNALPSSIESLVIPLPNEGSQSAEHLAKVLAGEIESHGKVIILAESYSGRIAYELLRRGSDQIIAVVLVASFLTVPRIPFRAAKFLPLRIFPWHFVPAWGLRLLCVGTSASGKLIHEIREAIRSVPKKTIAARVRELSILDSPVEKVLVPCFYLRASWDRLIPARHADDMKKWFQSVEIHAVDGAHFLVQSNPRACADHVARFCAERSASRRICP